MTDAISRGGNTANCPATDTTYQSMTIPGIQVGDLVLVAPRVAFTHVGVGVGFCAVAGTALVPFINPNAAAENPASATYDYVLMKKVG